MKGTIAVIDDEPDILELVSMHLEKEGFKVKKFKEGRSLLKFLDENIPELIILDLMLPDIDGLEICKSLKKQDKFAALPIIMLTAKGQEIDKVLGLELGADDYVTKPFSPRELIARVKAVLRRYERKEKYNVIKIGDSLVIYLQEYRATVKGENIDLTTTEFKILRMLAERPGWVFTRDQILDYLWGDDKAVLDRTVDVHINHLREKLGEEDKFIKNVRGVGYKLEI
ncbi:response regulator transcription factor [candidate division WOR-3 bacterium]|nr:response regulator transcription factor [candidate division WOR-3 bacterium]